MTVHSPGPIINNLGDLVGGWNDRPSLEVRLFVNGYPPFP